MNVTHPCFLYFLLFFFFFSRGSERLLRRKVRVRMRMRKEKKKKKKKKKKNGAMKMSTLKLMKESEHELQPVQVYVCPLLQLCSFCCFLCGYDMLVRRRRRKKRTRRRRKRARSRTTRMNMKKKELS